VNRIVPTSPSDCSNPRKTELLLELAHEYRNVTNVFFLHVGNGESLEDVYIEIATRVGHDILSVVAYG
jgi:hypothetical protein